MATPLMITYHPAYLLRNQSPSEKRKVWEDMLQVLERLEQPVTRKTTQLFPVATLCLSRRSLAKADVRRINSSDPECFRGRYSDNRWNIASIRERDANVIAIDAIIACTSPRETLIFRCNIVGTCGPQECECARADQRGQNRRCSNAPISNAPRILHSGFDALLGSFEPLSINWLKTLRFKKNLRRVHAAP